ncbi:MAG: fatty acid desaturase [Phyllobacteriaceae bacterium]|nr:fatty acid desaturase [Phyllobacteriaceae bacterium]
MPHGTRIWIPKLARYAEPDNKRGMWELALTLTLFAALWLAMWGLSFVSGWLALAALLPTAVLLVRLFILQHDCGHGSLFSSHLANDWIGRALGVLTLTPYDWWKHSHARHHASSGNLDKRGIGDINTLTVAEYRARTPLGRLAYRAYRHPFVLFVIGPIYMFVFQHRLPAGAWRSGAGPWLSTMGTNAGLVALVAILILVFGLKTFLFLHMPLVVLAAIIGVWMFYVQHQFNPTYWEHASEWEREQAALHGSSYYDLPKPMMWATGNIGIHHVHHLASRIPFFRLPQVLKDHPELTGLGRLTFWDSIKCVRLALWDEKGKRLVSFREANALA